MIKKFSEIQEYRSFIQIRKTTHDLDNKFNNNKKKLSLKRKKLISWS